jgi:hypothetical protein
MSKKEHGKSASKARAFFAHLWYNRYRQFVVASAFFGGPAAAN